MNCYDRKARVLFMCFILCAQTKSAITHLSLPLMKRLADCHDDNFQWQSVEFADRNFHSAVNAMAVL